MKNNLPELCGSSKCTACTSCYSSCPKSAISMGENHRGELHPVINPDLCIGCGLCEKSCPELNNSRPRNSLPKVYCCWLKDSEIRKGSTSGGLGYAIASTVIEMGGHVWGAAYGENLAPIYIEANTIDELRPIQKSKYVQCALNDTFIKIREELQRGDLVLFTGTGCHVKGLLSFLRKPYDNLITVDLVCHGVPGQGIFRKYKSYLENKYSDHIISFDFRPKRKKDGQEISYCTIAHFKERGSIKIRKKENGYFIGFQHNVFLRECCHDCQSNGRERYSDITIADFWGLGKLQPFHEWKQRTLGISMLALNSKKAEDFFSCIKDKLVYELRSIEEACVSNHPYEHSSIKSVYSDEFFRDFNTCSWEELTDKYLRMSKKEEVLYQIKKICPPICYHMLNFWRNGLNK